MIVEKLILFAVLLCLSKGLVAAVPELEPRVILSVEGSPEGRFRGRNRFEGLTYDKSYNLTTTCSYNVPDNDTFTIFINVYTNFNKEDSCPVKPYAVRTSKIVKSQYYVTEKARARKGVSMVAEILPGKTYCVHCATNYVGMGGRRAVKAKPGYTKLTTAVADSIFEVENMAVDVDRIPNTPQASVRVINVNTYPSPIYSFNNCTSPQLSEAISAPISPALPPSTVTGVLVLPAEILEKLVWCLVTVDIPGRLLTKNLSLSLRHTDGTPCTATPKDPVAASGVVMSEGTFVGVLVATCVSVVGAIVVVVGACRWVRRKRASSIIMSENSSVADACKVSDPPSPTPSSNLAVAVPADHDSPPPSFPSSSHGITSDSSYCSPRAVLPTSRLQGKPSLGHRTNCQYQLLGKEGSIPIRGPFDEVESDSPEASQGSGDTEDSVPHPTWLESDEDDGVASCYEYGPQRV